ncbi:hypothetical protein FQA39_LY07615 [Lamprigera yunnana]|nr:hypothetical protein FQA39_LY07615 [Lamprigera yunnana]
MNDPIVTVDCGILRGRIVTDYDGRNYYSFQGIPYAKPPIGTLRFKAPQLPEPWVGVRDATERGNCSLSEDPFNPNDKGSEDCLFLNVYTAELPKNNTSLKPVMVWIHGGGFVTGSSTTLYGPEFLITKDVVIVTINYRLGLAGFLNFDDPTLGIPGNAGFKDQVMALRWVKKNIKQFGGDHNNVTIFGGSAGSASVHFLMCSPLAKGLFHKAILQSGTAFTNGCISETSLRFVTAALNIETTSEKKVLDILLKMDSEKLLKLQEKIPDDMRASFIRGFGLVVEKVQSESAFLTQDPKDLILSGNYNHVPIIIGYNSREGLIAEVASQNVKKNGHTVKDFEDFIPYDLRIQTNSIQSKSIANKVKNFYYGSFESTEDKKNQYFMLEGDYSLLWPTLYAAKQHSLTSKNPVYLYRFSLESTLNAHKRVFGINNSPGVTHGDELGYLFKCFLTPTIIPGSVEDDGMRRCVTLWTNFAKYGNPNPPQFDPLINVIWKPVKNGVLNYLEIGENLTTGVNPDEKRMKLWDDIYSIKYPLVICDD